MDDIFLLRFLRTRKFDLDSSIELLKNYYEMKRINEDISGINFATIQPLFAKRISIVLKERDSEGRKILYLRAGMWDANEFSYGELMMAAFYMMEEITRSEETQKNGVIAILDNGGMGWKQTAKIVHHLPFKKIGKLVPFFQGSFPARFKAIHVINAPYVFDMVYAAVKVFLKDKLRKRIIVHGDNIASLHKYVKPEILPRSLGGVLTIENAEDTQLMTDMLNREEYYKNMTKYGFR